MSWNTFVLRQRDRFSQHITPSVQKPSHALTLTPLYDLTSTWGQTNSFRFLSYWTSSRIDSLAFFLAYFVSFLKKVLSINNAHTKVIVIIPTAQNKKGFTVLKVSTLWPSFISKLLFHRAEAADIGEKREKGGKWRGKTSADCCNAFANRAGALYPSWG